MKQKRLFAIATLLVTFALSACSNPFLPNKSRKSSRENEVSIPDPVSEESTSRRSRSRNYSSEEHLEHSWSEWSIKKKATCLEDGYQERYCSCGEIESEVVSALGHDFDNGIILSDTSDCQTYGVRYTKCSRCSEISIYEGYGEHQYTNKTFVESTDSNIFSPYTREFCPIDDTMRLTIKAVDAVQVNYELSSFDTVKITDDSIYFEFELNNDLDSKFDYIGTLYQKIYIDDFSIYGSYSYGKISAVQTDYYDGAFCVNVNGEIIDKTNVISKTYKKMTRNGEILDSEKDISPYALCEIGECTLKDGINFIKYSINYFDSPFKDFLNLGEIVFVGKRITVEDTKTKYGTAHNGTLADPFTPEDAIKVASSSLYSNEYYYVSGIIDMFITSPGNNGNNSVAWYFKPEQEGGERFEAYGVYKQDGSYMTDDDVWVGGYATIYGKFRFYHTVYETANAIFISCEGDKPSGRQYIDSNFDDVYHIGFYLFDNAETYDYYRFKAYVTAKNGYNYYLTREKDEELRVGTSDEQHGSQPIYENAIELYRVIDVDVVNKLTKGAYIEVTMNIKNYHGQPENGIALTANDVTVINSGSSWEDTFYEEPSVRVATVTEFVTGQNNSMYAYKVTGKIIDMKENILTISDGSSDLPLVVSFNESELSWDSKGGYYSFTSGSCFDVGTNTGGLTLGKYATFKLIHTSLWVNNGSTEGGIGVLLASYDYEPTIENEGYKVTFNLEHCSVNIYIEESFDERYIDQGYPYYSRLYNGNIGFSDTNYIFFEIICDYGYEFNPGLEIGDSLQYNCSYISGLYSYIRRKDTNRYMIKGVESDITINLKATPINSSSYHGVFVGFTDCKTYLTAASLTNFIPNFKNQFFKCTNEIWFMVEPTEGYSIYEKSVFVSGSFSYFEQFNKNIFVVRDIIGDEGISIYRLKSS